MFNYSDFVERLSSRSVRPELIARLIHGSVLFTIVCLCVILYLTGWLFEMVMLGAVLVVIAWLGFLFVHRSRSNKDTPPDLSLDPMIKPEPYDERYHVKHFLKRAAPLMALALFSLMVIVLLIFGGAQDILGLDATASVVGTIVLVLIGGLVIIANAFLIYRQWWKWNNWRIVGDPLTGQIGFLQPDSPRWLFVKGSSIDNFNLDEYTLYTPEKSTAEFLFFKRSQMVGLLQGNVAGANLTRRDFKQQGGPPHHEDVKDVDRLIGIQRYWRALARQEEVHSRSTVELLETSVTQGEMLIKQNDRIIALLSTIAGVPIPDSSETTQLE